LQLGLLDPIGDLLNLEPQNIERALGYAGPPRPAGTMVPPWQIRDSDNYGHGSYLPPSDPSDTFPVPGAPWENAAGFISRAFNGQAQTWP
jgi:hypothetical protein